MLRKRPRSTSPVRDNADAVFISNPIEDRGSTHIGLYSPTVPAKTLRARPDVREASHRITAWRMPGKQKSLSGQPIYDLGHDDDGEQYAGKKLEKLLADLKVEGTVIVARWYGGIMLGPVRFTHFENCAREAIARWKQETNDAAKRQKVEADEEVEKEKLVKTLQQRDSNIAVLRDLLYEKTSASMVTEKTSPLRSQAQGTNYSMMDLPTLRRLEKARDGTVAWILKQIDKAEEAPKIAEAAKHPKTLVDETKESAEEVNATLIEESKTKDKSEEPS